MIELQLEGLVGPTHNYAGLSFGNVASATHAQSVSHPRAAALQSLEKMQAVQARGIPVAVMPPQPRPDLSILTRLGYQGSVQAMLDAAWRDAPDLAAAIWSASSMWTANAATVAPSADALDERLHLTPANLFSTFHRAIEPRTTTHFLRQLFAEPTQCVVHDPLPVTTRLADEGAANHMRLVDDHGRGLHVFVFGATPDSPHHPRRYPARQQRAACEAITRMHQLPPEQCIYLQQAPEAIDAGVFHNDVIAMSAGSLLICHERAYVDQAGVLDMLAARGITVRVIRERELSLAKAVATYFFNAQLLEPQAGRMTIIFPQECAEQPETKALCERLPDELPMVKDITFLNLRESMQNGGGPACLRLRVPLSEAELAAMPPGARFSQRLYQRLGELISADYPEQLEPGELGDAALAKRLQAVQDRIMSLLGLHNPA